MPSALPSLARLLQPWLRVPTVALCSGLVALACHGSVQTRMPETGLPRGDRIDSEAKDGRARWHLHPLSKKAVTSALSLPGGARLEVDLGGSRWLSLEGKPPQASPFSAPEPLVGVLRIDGGFAAIGKSGAVYEFSEPLGPWGRTTTPPQVFARTLLSGSTLLSLNGEGRVFRSEDLGRSFHLAESPVPFADFGRNERGDIYAVSIPERWFRSQDDGRSFELLPLSSVAPMGIEHQIDGALVVRGLLGVYVPHGSEWRSVDAGSNSKSDVVLPSFARASQIAAGTAVVDHAGYLSLNKDEAEDVFLVERGNIGDELKRVYWPRPRECSQFRVAGGSARPLLLCSRGEASGVSPLVRLYEWNAEQASWQVTATPLRGSFTGITLRSSPRGKVAMTGVCAPHQVEEGCDPYGIVELPKGDEKKPEVRFIQVPTGYEVIDLAYDTQDRLWVLSHRGKDNHLLLQGPFEEGRGPGLIDLTLLDGALLVDKKRTARLLLRDEGVYTVLAQRFGAYHIAQLDEDGVLLSATRAPLGVQSIDGTGRRLAGIDVARSLYWESTTGGLTWKKQSLPSQVCSRKQCEVPLRCSALGCLVGDELVRTGFEGPRVDPVRPPREVVGDDAPSEVVPPVKCSALGAQRVELHHAFGLPSAHDVLLGSSLWYLMEGDEESASARVLSAPVAAAQVREHLLFPPKQPNQDFVLKYFPQVEGAAVVRHRVSGSNRELSGPVEVAWDNRLESVTEHVKIGPGAPGLGSEMRLGTQLSVEMLSVAGEGIFVQFAQDRKLSPYYFPGSNQAPELVERAQFPSLSSSGGRKSLMDQLARGARTEGVFAHGSRSNLLLLANNRVVVRQMKGGASSKHVPYLMGAVGGAFAQFGSTVQIAYLGSRVGFLSVAMDEEGTARDAWFVELGKERAFEPPVPASLPRHLPPRPSLCSEATRLSTPRVVMAEQPGRVRDVAVSGLESTAVHFAVTDGVFFGTPEAPCLGAWTAEFTRDQLNGSDQDVYQAVVVPNSSAISWVFRVHGRGDAMTLVAAPMSCSFE